MMSPLLVPHTVILTWGMLGWRFAAARVLVPFLILPALGVLLNRFDGRPGWRVPPVVSGGAQDCHECACTPLGQSASSGRRSFLGELKSILRDRSAPFFLGLALAAVLTTLLPEDTIPRTIGSAGVFAFLIAALVGIPVYVCEGEEVALTYAALGLGLAPGPAFTFLLASVGTCVPTMLAAQGIIGRRTTALYIGAWVVFAIGAGILFGLFSRT